MEPAELEQAVESIVGPEGRVGYTCFMGELLASKAADENRVLWREFRQLDSTGSGCLEREQIARLLELPALAEVVGGRGADALMAMMDVDGGGRVVFEEFRAALSGNSREQK